MNSYARAAWRSFTLRRVLFTQAVALVIAYSMSLEWGYYGENIAHVSMHFVTMSVYAFLLIPVAFCADEVIVRGMQPIVMYVILLVFVNQMLASGVAGAMQWLYCALWSIPWPAVKWGFTSAGGHMSVPCSLGLLIFLNGRAADRMLERVRGAELRRVQLDQQLVESRLATAEAQIDPQMLFGALAKIKQGLEESQLEAEHNLDDLIQRLRGALASARTVGTEELRQ